MAKIVELEIKDLHIPQGLLPRVLTGTVEEKVEEYRELIEECVEFDPILVWEREDGQYWVIDGVHRIEAHKRAGKERIKAKLVKCKDELDYRIKAIQANLKHGLALARGERPELARILYRQGVKEEEIRRIFGVSQDTVRKWLAPVKQEEKEKKIRKALELRERGLSIREIAKELGEPKTTIERWLSHSGNLSQIGTLSLLTPTGDPTPEGIKLFSQHLESHETKLPPAWNYSNFERWLEREGKEVEGSVKDFVRCFTSVMSRTFKLFAQEKEEYSAVRKYLETKEPIKKLTPRARKLLLDWAERYYKKELEEIVEKEASSPPLAHSSPFPSLSPLAGSQPAPSEEEEDYLKKAEKAWEKLQAEGGPPKIELVEDENGMTHVKLLEEEQKPAKGKRGRPPKPQPEYTKEAEIEELKNIMRDALWTLVNKFGWETAGKVLDEVVEEYREYAPEKV